MKQTAGEWYSGTANAIYQNIEYIEAYQPEYVLILSGDQIYKMDYSEMLEFHEEKDADVTIAILEVPWEDASRFGIMNTEEDNKVYEFVEKPKNPISNKASMGIYIFTWKKLRHYLMEDQNAPGSSNDFGKDIIPKMLKDGERMYAYPFKGYWRDVGTIQSLWEANMDLLMDGNELNIHDHNWKIYSVNPMRPPQYLGEDADVKGSLIVEGCAVFGKVNRSVLFPGVYVGKNTKIIDSVIFPNTKIGDNVTIYKAIIGSDVIIRKNSTIGNMEKITVIGEGEEIKSNSQLY
jgi:glucose-1-phosphate adenylyltransferase